MIPLHSNEESEKENNHLEKAANLSSDINEKFEMLLDSMSEGYIETDLSGRVLRCNKVVTDFNNIPKEEMIGKNHNSLFPPERSGIVFEMFSRVYQTGIPSVIKDFVVYKKDGSKAIVEAKICLIRNKSGEPVGFCTITNDITTQRETERALHESEDSYRKILELAPDTIVISRLSDAAYLQVNDMFCIRTQYSREEAIGKTAEELNIYAAPEDMVRLREVLIKKGRADAFETRFRRRDGAVGDVLVSARLIHYQGHDCMLAISKNITDLKEAQNALGQSEKRFRTIFESAEDAIFLKDAKLRYTLVNPSMERLFGIQASEVLGKTDEMVFGKTESLITGTVESEVLTGKIIRQDEQRTCCGLLKQFQTIRVPMSGTDGTITGLYGFSRDMTDTRKLEAQLLQAQKMEAIGTLAGGIAHDFNNILSPLMGYAELLRDDIPGNSPLQNYLNEILRAASRAKDLVQQILTFSRQDDQDIKPVKIGPVVQEALKLLRSTIPKTIEIIEDIDPDCGAVFAHPTQMHQIIMNLATNAYHAMEETPGMLKVQLKQVRLDSDHWAFPELAPGEYVQLCVADSGVGIKKQDMDKIFDPYFTTKEHTKGTGLGLSVVQGIVKKLKGLIHVYSEPGKGTEVHVYLSLADRFSSNLETSQTLPVSGGSENILLVDDEDTIVKLQRNILERLGYRVSVYTRSMEALEAFRKNPAFFDLIVTDMTMPVMTGARLAAEIRRIRPDIPVILCTGFSDQVNEEKCRSMGIQGYILKPIIRTEFTRMIRRLLDQ